MHQKLFIKTKCKVEIKQTSEIISEKIRTSIRRNNEEAKYNLLKNTIPGIDKLDESERGNSKRKTKKKKNLKSKMSCEFLPKIKPITNVNGVIIDYDEVYKEMKLQNEKDKKFLSELRNPVVEEIQEKPRSSPVKKLDLRRDSAIVILF